MNMEEEIDLRVYIAVLLRYKVWIAGLAVVAALVALIISFLLPPTFNATALVAITEPRYAMQFDPRVQSVNGSSIDPPYNAYPALALGDELISTLIQDLDAELEKGERIVRIVREMLEAKAGSDPSIVKLTAKDRDPQRAATIANRWAALFVQFTNQLYGEDEQELAFFQAQLTEAQAALSQAEQDLIDFQARDEASILSAQLDSKRAAFRAYLDTAVNLRLIIQDAKSLRDRQSAQDVTLQASLNDELALLFLEIGALSSEVLPIQLQISDQRGFSDRTVGEQIAFLDSLIEALQKKLVIVEAAAESLEPDILTLQQDLQQANTEYDRLDRAKTVAAETFMTLSRKVDETRIAVQDEPGDVRLVSRAGVPDEPVSPRKLVNTAVAGALGLFVGIFGAFAIEYWRSGELAPEKALSGE